MKQDSFSAPNPRGGGGDYHTSIKAVSECLQEVIHFRLAKINMKDSFSVKYQPVLVGNPTTLSPPQGGDYAYKLTFI